MPRLLLAAAILALSVCHAADPAAPAKPRNLVHNAGFETLDAKGAPKGCVFGQEGGALALSDLGEKRTGARSIKIVTGDNPEAAARVYVRVPAAGLAPGDYTCSIWTRLNRGEKAGRYDPSVTLRVRCMDKAGKQGPPKAIAMISFAESHDWTRRSCVVNLPQDTDHVLIDFGVPSAIATAWFDDLQLEAGATPTDFEARD